MAYWLLKSEPKAWSWSDQCAVDFEPWTGVRNYQARNNLRAMQIEDRAFFYHSVDEKQIVGIVKIVRAAYPDPSDHGEKWSCVDVASETAFTNPVSLADMKNDPTLQGLGLFKQSRLSVVPIEENHWHHICQIGL